jgi:hypothetical protein
MARIKITDDRQGRSFRTGINGRFYDIPRNTEIEVEDEMVDHLKGLGVGFEEIEGSSKGASSSKEGSGDVLAPVALGPNDVIAPAMDARSLNERPLAGDQPGDVTLAGGLRTSTGKGSSPSIKEDAEISDIRVAAERAAPKDASTAEIAGEGEAGTPKAETQGVEPSHVKTEQDKATERAAAPTRASAPKKASSAKARK